MAIAGYGHSLSVGDYCSIAHRATLHGCKIGDNVLIGIGATILDRCEIGDNSIVAAHSLLREGTIIPPNSLVVGTPGVVRLTRGASVENRRNALLYHRDALAYTQGDHRAWVDLATANRCAGRGCRMVSAALAQDRNDPSACCASLSHRLGRGSGLGREESCAL